MNEKIKAVLGNALHPERVKEWLESQGATDFGDLDFTDAYGVYFVRPDGQAGCIYKIYSFLFDVVALPRWRAKKGEIYHFVTDWGVVIEKLEEGTYPDDIHYEVGNYFRTYEEAKEVCSKFVELLKRGNDE